MKAFSVYNVDAIEHIIVLIIAGELRL